MINLYGVNGILFWSEKDLNTREMFEKMLVTAIKENLKEQNRGFDFFKCEAPLLTPENMVNPNYTNEDIWIQEGGELVLRPETTMGSYLFAKHLMNPHNDIKVKPPIVVYQHGKSFRREQDQVTTNMRLKEFYQLEFQIIYSLTTKNDYSLSLIPAIQKALSNLIGPCRVENSDRLPDYSEWTKDIVCEKSNMEICSISKRKDFGDSTWTNLCVLEVAIGTDRMVFNFNNK